MGTINYGQLRDMALKLINQYSIAGGTVPGSYNNQQDYLARIPALVNDALLTVATTARPICAQAVISPENGEDYGDYLRYLLPEDCLRVRPGGLLLPERVYGRARTLPGYILQEPDFLLVRKPFLQDAVLEYYRRPQLLPDNIPVESKVQTVDRFTGDGSTLVFTMSGDNITLVNSVTVAGTAVTAYTADLAAKTITFTTAPASGAAILVTYTVLQTTYRNAQDTDGIDAEPDAQMAIAYYVAAHLALTDDSFLYASLYNEWETKLARLTRPVQTEIGTVTDAYGLWGCCDG